MVSSCRNASVCIPYSYFCPWINNLSFLALEECRACTLAPEKGFEALESIDLGVEGATHDTYDFAKLAAPTFLSLALTFATQNDIVMLQRDPSIKVAQ